MGYENGEPAAQPPDAPSAEPVPALVNSALLGIAQAYIPPLRSLDANELAAQIWTGEPHLIYVPAEQLISGGSEPDEEGNALALGTVAFGIRDAQTGADTYRIFLNVVPYSEQNIEVALETDALAHAIGASQPEDMRPAQTYSLWFVVGAPEERLDAPEMYVIGSDGIDGVDEFTEGQGHAATLIAFTDMWPPSTAQEHALRFWDLLDELAQRIIVSLIDGEDEN